MREFWLFAFGAFLSAGALMTLMWVRSFERRTQRLGWEEDRPGPFGRKRWLRFIACTAAAIGAYVALVFGIGIPSGPGHTNELGVVFILISVVWLGFRKDIAGCQYQIVLTMLNQMRPGPDKENVQVRAMESLGIAFSVLLFISGALLLTLNLAA